MKVIQLVIIMISIIISCSKLRKTKCNAEGDDCDFIHTCCGENVCRDYRCSPKDAEQKEVDWSPKGTKCDWLHRCEKNYLCQSHRCVLDAKKTKKILGDITDEIED